ncbi:hypothetical protein BC829DRAFT_433394 [Chytridium lagenaria]|nr:hypothetical protein BC829DRAFT_433394 [Chytridium lagenaria]
MYSYSPANHTPAELPLWGETPLNACFLSSLPKLKFAVFQFRHYKQSVFFRYNCLNGSFESGYTCWSRTTHFRIHKPRCVSMLPLRNATFSSSGPHISRILPLPGSHTSATDDWSPSTFAILQNLGNAKVNARLLHPASSSIAVVDEEDDDDNRLITSSSSSSTNRLSSSLQRSFSRFRPATTSTNPILPRRRLSLDPSYSSSSTVTPQHSKRVSFAYPAVTPPPVSPPRIAGILKHSTTASPPVLPIDDPRRVLTQAIETLKNLQLVPHADDARYRDALVASNGNMDAAANYLIDNYSAKSASPRSHARTPVPIAIPVAEPPVIIQRSLPPPLVPVSSANHPPRSNSFPLDPFSSSFVNTPVANPFSGMVASPTFTNPFEFPPVLGSANALHSNIKMVVSPTTSTNPFDFPPATITATMSTSNNNMTAPQNPFNFAPAPIPTLAPSLPADAPPYPFAQHKAESPSQGDAKSSIMALYGATHKSSSAVIAQTTSMIRKTSLLDEIALAATSPSNGSSLAPTSTSLGELSLIPASSPLGYLTLTPTSTSLADYTPYNNILLDQLRDEAPRGIGTLQGEMNRPQADQIARAAEVTWDQEKADGFQRYTPFQPSPRHHLHLFPLSPHPHHLQLLRYLL